MSDHHSPPPPPPSGFGTSSKGGRKSGRKSGGIKNLLPLLVFLFIAYSFFSGGPSTCSRGGVGGSGSSTPSGPVLSVVAGSESKEIEPLIHDIARENGFSVQMHYKGSVDMMLELQDPSFGYDAVLPANSIWIRLGDKALHRVKDEASIMRSPVVLGVKRSVAESLGFVGRDVTVGEILEAVQAGKLTFAMTSATQSNSGASAYLGLLHALAGSPPVLEETHLASEEVRDRVKRLLAGINRSSGSSGWLKDLFLERPDEFTAMFNYESMVIAANRELSRQGRETLYCVYPVDGLAIADSTLGFVATGQNAEKRELFQKLRDGLLEPEAQERIFTTGFRTALIGMNPTPDLSVYNPDWGIDLARTISPIPWPRAEVVEQALMLYQGVLRKPSYTVYLLDVSGSMKAQGLPELQRAMAALLDQNRAGRFLIQASEEDVTVVLPFNHQLFQPMQIRGNEPMELGRLNQYIQSLVADGGTNIYLPVTAAFSLFAEEGQTLSRYLPAVVLLTDGRSQNGSLEDVRRVWQTMNAPFEFPPVFGVTFGQADDQQLKELSHFAGGRVFDGRHGLEQAFRKARGYN